MRELSAIETDYVAVSVRAVDRSTNLPVSVSSDVAQVAFVAIGATPGDSDWHTATWLSTVTGAEVFGVLVGPANGGLVLAVGSYEYWARVQDSPEQPTRAIDELRIT